MLTCLFICSKLCCRKRVLNVFYSQIKHFSVSLRLRSPVEATFLSGVFSPLTSAEACEKSSRWLWKESCVSTGLRKPGNTFASPTAMI